MATFGKLTDGASSSASSATRVWVSTATPASTGTVQTGHARMWLSGADTVPTKAVIYADSAGSPGALLAESDILSLTATAEAEQVFTFSGANAIQVTSGTPYWIGIAWEDPGTVSVTISRDGTASSRHEQSLTWPTLPDPYGTPTATNSGPIDVYITFSTGTSASAEHTSGTGTAHTATAGTGPRPGVATGTGTAHTPVAGTVDGRTIVVMVGDSAALTSGDDAVIARLTAAGHTTVARSDELSVYTGAYDGFVIAESVSSGNAGTKYSTSKKPGILLEGNIWAGHNLSGTFSTVNTQTAWNVQSTPPLNAGLTGSTTVYSASQSQHCAAISGLGAGAQVVAQIAADATRSPYFAYEAGAAIVTGNAPARRVAMGLINAGAAALTADGQSLLDAAIAWAFTGSIGDGDAPAATGTGAANDPTIATGLSVAAEHASGTGAAQAAAAQLAPSAGAATGTGAANQPTVDTGSGGGSAGGVRGRTSGKNDTAGTSQVVTLPVETQSGDRVVVCFSADTATITLSTATTGWTKLGQASQGATTNHSAAIFTALGSAGDLTVTLSAAQECTWIVHALVGDGGTPEVISNNGGSATSAPIVDITGLTSGNYNSLIYCSVDTSTDTDFDLVASPPAGYTDTVTQRAATTSGAHTFSADRVFTAVTSVSPGSWTLDEAEQWITWHVVLPGGAAATSASAGLASGTGAAHQPSINNGAGTNVNAGHATGTGIARQPTVTSGTSEPTPAHPGEALWIGSAGGKNHFDVGIGQGTTGGTNHVNYTQAQIEGGFEQGNRFFLTSDREAVEFRINAGAGKTSTNTKFPRTELREYLANGTTKAAWDGSSGRHYMSGRSRITELTTQRPWVCFFQIHDAVSDLHRVQVQGTDIVARWTPPGGSDQGPVTLRSGYTLGTWISWEIEVNAGTLRVWLDGVLVQTLSNMGATGCYFKTGNYLQSNVADYGEDPNDESAVQIAAGSLEVWHTGYPTPTEPTYTGPATNLQTHRLYLTNTTGAPSVTAHSGWDQTAGSVARYLSPTAAGSPATVTVAETSTSGTDDVLLGQFISDPMSADGTLTGDIAAVRGVLESTAAADFSSAVVIRVVSNDGSVVRGVAINFFFTTEWPTSAQGFGLNVAATDVGFLSGDRIVVEYGYRTNNTVSTSYSGTLYYGGTDTTSTLLAAGETDFTKPSWITFQTTAGVSFVTPNTAASAGHASGTGTAHTPASIQVGALADAGLASGTGAAPQAGVTTPSTTSVSATAVAGTGTAHTPTVTASSSVAAGHASGTGAAYAATMSGIDPLGTFFMRDSLGTTAKLFVEAAFGADLTGIADNWEWTDLTQDVRQAGGSRISITVGRADEAATSQPATCALTLDNRSGDYSIGPVSQYWPYIRRNTPIRVQVALDGETRATVFWGFADGWQPTWDLTGVNAEVQLSASGTLRRLRQNQSPVLSSLRRAILARTDVVAYWPCEEGKRATSIASGLDGHSSMAITGATEQPFPKFAASTDFDCSAPLPEVALTTWRGAVPAYTPISPAEVQVRWLMVAPELMHGTEGTILSVHTTGSIVRWDVVYLNTGNGNLMLYSVSDAGVRTLRMNGGFNVNNTVRQCQLRLAQDGTSVDFGVEVLAVGFSVGGAIYDTITSANIGVCTAVTVSPNADIDDTAIGHIAVSKDGNSVYTEIAQLNANAGEIATARLTRLCDENNTKITIIGSSDIAMGAQGAEDLVTLLRECETADQGLLYDGLGPGLLYVTGAERANQAADLTLDVTTGQLVEDLAPIEDDQRNVNKVKASRKDGAEATHEDADGVLGTTAIGIYDDSIEVNIKSDEEVIDYASWLVNLGTVEGYRYPTLQLNFAKNPELVSSWLVTELSSRVDVEHIDTVRTQHPTGTVSLLLEGYTVEIDQLEWTAELNLSPYQPWRVGEYAALTADTGEYVLRTVGEGSTVATSAVAGATTLSVSTPSGPKWTTVTDDFPLYVDVGGIKVTVTAISGTGTTQTFTVTSATLTRALPAGLAVDLWQPTVLGL